MLRYVVDDGHSVMKEPMKDKRIIPVERIILLCFIGPEYRGCNPLADCYNVKHNDRNFDVKNSDHIDEARVAQNVYWDCYQGYCFAGSEEPRQYTFSEVERAYYFEHDGDHVEAQNERNEAARHKERNRTIDDVLKNKNTCPESFIKADDKQTRKEIRGTNVITDDGETMTTSEALKVIYRALSKELLRAFFMGRSKLD